MSPDVYARATGLRPMVGLRPAPCAVRPALCDLRRATCAVRPATLFYPKKGAHGESEALQIGEGDL